MVATKPLLPQEKESIEQAPTANDRAREWITRALVIGADDPATQYNVACGYTKLGETEPALDMIERMWPNVGEEIKMWIRHDSDFDALRSHPRFQKLLEANA